MAKIQRYISDVESELRSEQSSIMSPEEAAATKMAKTQVFLSAAETAGDVARHFSDLRAEEELNSAMAQYDSGTSTIDDSIDRLPPEVDADGNMAFTPNRMRNMQEGAHNSLTGAIRGQISSGKAKREFDRVVLARTRVRRDQMVAKELVAESKYRRNTALVESRMLSDKGMHEAAVARLDGALVAGSIDQVEHAKEINDAGRMNDMDYATSTANRGTIEDVEESIKAFTVGIHPDGTKMTLDEQEMYRVKNMLILELDKRTSPSDDALKGRQRATYANLFLQGNQQGGLAPQQVMDAYVRGDLSESQLTGLEPLMFGAEAGIIQDIPGNVQIADALMFQVLYQYEGNLENAVQEYASLVSLVPMTPETQMAKVAQLQDIIDKVYSDPYVQSLRKTAFETGAGYSEGDLENIEAKFFGQFNDLKEVGREFDRELILEAVRAPLEGKREYLRKWVEERKDFYRLKAISGELTKVGVNYDWDVSAKSLNSKELAAIGRDITAWDMGQGSTDASALQIEGALDNVKRLTGIDILSHVHLKQKEKDDEG